MSNLFKPEPEKESDSVEMFPGDYHTKCHDCGQFVKKSEWVPKNHRWKKFGLCGECLSYYDGALMADNAL